MEDINPRVEANTLKKYEAKGFEEGEKIGLEKGEKAGIEKGKKLGVEEGQKLGVKEGQKLGLEKVAINMLKQGFEIKDIQKVTGLSKQQILAFKKSKKPARP